MGSAPNLRLLKLSRSTTLHRVLRFNTSLRVSQKSATNWTQDSESTLRVLQPTKKYTKVNLILSLTIFSESTILANINKDISNLRPKMRVYYERVP